LIYLDNSATTKPHPLVVEAMLKSLTEDFGNPSSLYLLGLDAEKKCKAARSLVAKSFNALPEEVFFNSGGTEGDNTALKGVWEAKKKQGKRIITTQVEHPAVLQCCKWLEAQGADVVYLPVNKEGIIEISDFKEALNADTILVSIMQVNNETGAIMPLLEIRKILDEQKSSAIFHTDAVQAFGKESCDVKALGVDILSISGHKIHAPKGIGAIYIKKSLHLPPFMHGGGQEKGFRSGTENMPGIIGLGAATKVLLEEGEKRLLAMKKAKEALKTLILEEIPDVCINGPENACASVLNVSFLGCRAEVLLHTLDQKGICVSTGSACSSHAKASHVLSAMKLSKEALEGALRFSFCGDNTEEEMQFVAACLKEAVLSQRKLRSAFSKKH